MSREILQDIIDGFSPDKFTRFFREKNRSFAPRQESFTHYNDEYFSDGIKLGEIKFSESEKVVVCAFKANQPLSERSGKKAQYEKGKKILKGTQSDAGIVIFYDRHGNFRFSLIYPEAIGIRRQWSNFRRFTYFVSPDPEFTNKTFLQRIGGKDNDGGFSSLDKIKEAFSLSAVTDIFYKDFFVEYSKLIETVKKKNKSVDQEKARDFVLLLAVRTIFLGFIQKKGWIGNDDKFIQNLLKEYEKKYLGKDLFYKRWLTPLFFQALNSPPGRKVAYGDNDFSEATEKNLQMAPYLNGGLFKEKPDYDDQGYLIPDKEIKGFFDFLFSHNFTIEENSYEDEDLQLNPEFLGIIFERLVNKADGAVYTPRTEVDLMCRLSLVKWLQKNISSPIAKANLYELFFREGEKEEDQKRGSFSERETKEIVGLLENLTVCDPAVGSGAFLVGMMQVLDEIEQDLKSRIGVKDIDAFERKKRIIAQSLYGVEVKEWAVWICQLRLWLSLFIEAPDSLKSSFEPILPSLDFKVRQGDSLVQRVGSKSLRVLGHAMVGETVKRKVTQLKNLKNEYFGNKTTLKDWEIRQRELAIYEEILQSEIIEKRKELNRLKNVQPEIKSSLFGDEFFKPAQKELDFNKEKIGLLESEINEFLDQKQNIRKDKPLVWNIEFAEIFVEFGGFDIVIGNPPYVRQEVITDPAGKIKDKKQYKELLAEMVRLDFPADFSPKSKINAQSDLYTYFYIRALRLLNSKGIHTFICSNSWLDVGYGVWLQRFFLERAPVEFIIDNHAKRSFEAADVNTIISIIHAPVKKIDPAHLVKFVAFKKPFEESVFTEYLCQIEEAKEVTSNDIFRVYPIAIKDLQEAGTEYEDESEKQKKLRLGTYVGDKWGGKYLRAPAIFFTILEKGRGKFVKLSDIAEVRRGFTTGANEFFYLTDTEAKEWKIEAEFLKQVIKSPRECEGILVNTRNLKYKIFVCNKSKDELKGTNALKYIAWGEKQKTKDGVFWKNVPSVSSRKFWYGLGEREPARINFNYLIDEVARSYVGKIYVSDNFQEIHTDKNVELFLNSFVSYLFQVNTGRVGFGGGLLKIQTYEVKRLPVIESEIVNVRYFKNNDGKNIFEECGINPKSKIPIEEQEPKPLPDRAELDNIFFDVLGLTADERKDVYRAVCRLVWNRISKAKSV